MIMLVHIKPWKIILVHTYGYGAWEGIFTLHLNLEFFFLCLTKQFPKYEQIITAIIIMTITYCVFIAQYALS